MIKLFSTTVLLTFLIFSCSKKDVGALLKGKWKCTDLSIEFAIKERTAENTKTVESMVLNTTYEFGDSSIFLFKGELGEEKGVYLLNSEKNTLSCKHEYFSFDFEIQSFTEDKLKLIFKRMEGNTLISTEERIYKKIK